MADTPLHKVFKTYSRKSQVFLFVKTYHRLQLPIILFSYLKTVRSPKELVSFSMPQMSTSTMDVRAM